MLRTKFIAFCALPCLLLSGCSSKGSIYSNYHAIEEMQVIQTMGIDYSDEKAVTLSISSAAAGEKVKPITLSRDAESISRAIESLQDYAAKEDLFYAHTRYVLIGESAAENGLSGYLDYFERSPRLRMDMAMLVLKGSDAKELICAPTGEQYDITDILSSTERDAEHRSDSHVFTFAEVSQMLAESGSALICAVRSEDTKGSVFLSEQQKQEEGIKTAVLSGYAIISDGKLAGYIDSDISRGVNFLLNKVGSDSVAIVDINGDTLTTLFTSSSCEYVPIWSDSGELQALEINITVGTSVAELKNSQNMLSREYTEHLCSELSSTVKSWVTDVLAISSSSGDDFLGLGQKVRCISPVKFHYISAQWPEILKNLEFRVNVKSSVTRTYGVERPANTGGGGDENVEEK